MKKILTGVVAGLAALTLFSCASNGGAGGKASPFVITEGDGIIGCYTFDEEDGDDIVDHSGNELSLMSNALDGAEFVPGKNGSALHFNGEDEYLTLDESIFDGDGFTVAAWVKADAWLIWGRLFDFGGGNGHTDVFVAADGRIQGTLVFYEQSTASSCNAPLPPPGQWVHVAATYGDGKMALYVNGKKAQELDCPVTTAELALNDPNGIYIGRSNWPDPLFKGALDDLLVANRKLSDAEIKSVCAGVVGVDAE